MSCSARGLAQSPIQAMPPAVQEGDLGAEGMGGVGEAQGSPTSLGFGAR